MAAFLISLRRITIAILIANVSLLGCKHNAESNVSSEVAPTRWPLGQLVWTPEHTTYVFSWTNNASLKDNYLQEMDRQLAAARVRNAQGNSVDYRSAKAGAGIYGATDPFVSKSFGKYLLIIPIAANQTLTALGGSIDGELYRNIVQSDAPGVVYPWQGYLQDSNGQSLGYAVVIRDSSILKPEEIKIIGPVEPDYSCRRISKMAAPTEDWQADLAQIPTDFYFCTAPIIANYIGTDWISSVDKLGTHSLYFDLLFAAQIRSGSFIVELAGIDEDAISCRDSSYCSYKLGQYIEQMVKKELRYNQGGEEPRDLLTLEEAVSAAKAYKLLNDSDTIASPHDFVDALAHRLRLLYPEFGDNLRSQITFFNGFIRNISPHSMSVWR